MTSTALRTVNGRFDICIKRETPDTIPANPLKPTILVAKCPIPPPNSKSIHRQMRWLKAKGPHSRQHVLVCNPAAFASPAANIELIVISRRSGISESRLHEISTSVLQEECAIEIVSINRPTMLRGKCVTNPPQQVLNILLLLSL